MKKITAVILVLFMLILASCTESAADETEKQTDTEQSTEALTETETEPEETEPEETAVMHEAVTAEGFKFSKKPAETVTELSGEAPVSVKDGDYKVEYESRFYGPQSMIDRDSHHMGDLYVAAKYASEYPQDEGYVYGEFTGDRYSEYVIFTEDELKIYKGMKRAAKYNDSKLLYTQNIDIDGDLRGTGDFNCDGFTDLLFVTGKKTAFIGYGSENGFDLVSQGIIAVKGSDTSSWTVKENKAELYSNKPLNVKDEYGCLCIADVNTDGICDLIVAIDGVGLRSYYGQKDGQFGPHENEIGNINFYPTWEYADPIKYMTAADINEDGVDDIVATMIYKNSKDYLICALINNGNFFILFVL